MPISLYVSQGSSESGCDAYHTEALRTHCPWAYWQQIFNGNKCSQRHIEPAYMIEYRDGWSWCTAGKYFFLLTAFLFCSSVLQKLLSVDFHNGRNTNHYIQKFKYISNQEVQLWETSPSVSSALPNKRTVKTMKQWKKKKERKTACWQLHGRKKNKFHPLQAAGQLGAQIFAFFILCSNRSESN